jgi:hypothetical protein
MIINICRITVVTAQNSHRPRDNCRLYKKTISYAAFLVPNWFKTLPQAHRDPYRFQVLSVCYKTDLAIFSELLVLQIS